MSDSYKTILLFGPPGSGKGLQGKILNSIPGFYHCAMGDIFRNLNPDSESGKLFFNYSFQGLLVPDEVTIRIWKEYMETQCENGAFHAEKDFLILDGMPRTVEQVQKIQQYVDVQKVVYLKCDDKQVLINRIHGRTKEGNRVDDAKEEIVRNRLEVYEKETSPVIEQPCYTGKVAHIDGLRTPAEVLNQILTVLIPLMVNS